MKEKDPDTQLTSSGCDESYRGLDRLHPVPNSEYWYKFQNAKHLSSHCQIWVAINLGIIFQAAFCGEMMYIMGFPLKE